MNLSQEGMGPRPIRADVKGAPFKIGNAVRVTRGSDETFDPSYRGRVGIVEYLEYECGCGQSYPHDPMIGVRFRNAVAEFWREELKSKSDRSRRAGARTARRYR